MDNTGSFSRGKYLTIQVDSGTGFNIENSIKIDFEQYKRPLRIEIAQNRNIKSFLLEPLNDSFVIRINCFSIICDNEDIIELTPAGYRDVSGSGHLFYSVYDSAQILFSLENAGVFPRPIEIIVDIEYIKTGQNALREIECGREESANELVEAYEKKIKSINDNLQIFDLPHLIKFSDSNISGRKLQDDLDLLLTEPYIPKIFIDKPIDILIPVYNGIEHLHRLFGSIIKNTSVPYRLLIANDYESIPETSKWLYNFKNSHPGINIVIVENEPDLRGFVKNINRLAKLTENHFVLLNTDTEVPPRWLERLIFPIIEMDNIASATPFTNSGTHCSFPHFKYNNSQIFEDMDLESIDYYFQHVDFHKNFAEIPTGVGFCMAINKKVYDEIGMFDEIFGKGYFEENDWCMRAFNSGYKNIIVPNLFIYHKNWGSFLEEERKELWETNIKLMEHKHPEYFTLIQEFERRDPLKYLRNILQIKILSDMAKPDIIFDHNWGGGANEYTNSYAKNKKITIIIKVISILRLDIQCMEFHINGTDKFCYIVNDIKDIEKAISFLRITNIIINELVSHLKIFDIIDFLILSQKNNHNIKYTYIVHDFYCVCPMLNLIDYNIKYCDIPSDTNYCRRCLKSNPLADKIVPLRDYPNLTIGLWRKKFESLLKICEKILCFSNSSMEIITKVYPGLPKQKFCIKQHQVDWIRPVETDRIQAGAINIAVIGKINIEKGAAVIHLLADYISKNYIKIKIHSFGELLLYSNNEVPNNIVLHGIYKKEELPSLMEYNKINIIFIPSICPETFSYTTEEAIKMNMPVAVFDLGAPAERVKLYEKGIILTKYEPDYIIGEFIKFIEKTL